MKNNRPNKKYEIDMCNGPLLGKIFRFAVSLMISSLLQIMFNAADVIVVSRFGSDYALAAMGSTSTVVSLITNIFVGLAAGTTVIASRYVGAKHEQGARNTVQTSLTFGVILGAAVMAVGWIVVPPAVVKLDVPAEVAPLCVQYLRIYLLGSIPVSLYNFGAGLLRAKGDTQRPLYYLFFAGVINVALNLVFVIVLHLDVAGVALATILSQTVSAVLVVTCLVREQGVFHLDLRSLGIHPATLGSIIRTGAPASLQGIAYSISNLVMQAGINSFGADTMSGCSAAFNIMNFVWVGMNAFAQAGMAFMGSNLGAGKYTRIDKVNRTSLLCTFLTGAVLGNLVVLFGETLLSIYTAVPVQVETGMILLRIFCGLYAICGAMDCMAANLRGLGYSTIPMVVTLVCACGFRVVWAQTVFLIPEFHSVFFLHASYPISWSASFLILWGCYKVVHRRYHTEDVD